MSRKSKKTMRHYRQGDILVQEVNALPHGVIKDAPATRIVLGEGETAGHRHEILDTSHVEAYRFAEGLYLTVDEETTLVHPEHEKIALEPGTYEIIRQTEFARREFVRVQD